MLIGTPWVEDGKLYNAVACSIGGAIAAVRFKVDLPNYGVFDEKRVFAPGPAAGAGQLPRRAPRHADLRGHLGRRGGRVPGRDRRRAAARAERLALSSATRSTCASTSRVARVIESGLPLVYVNQVGGQDELVFDGGSFVLTPTARSPSSCRPSARQSSSTTTGERSGNGWRCAARADARSSQRRPDQRRSTAPACWACATTSSKNGFKGVVLGLSGGIDSALVAAIAVDALGAERVRCVMLP